MRLRFVDDSALHLPILFGIFAIGFYLISFVFMFIINLFTGGQNVPCLGYCSEHRHTDHRQWVQGSMNNALPISMQRQTPVELSELPFAEVQYQRVTTSMPGVITFTHVLRYQPSNNMWYMNGGVIANGYDACRHLSIAEVYPSFNSPRRYLETLFAGNGFVVGRDTFTALHVIENEYHDRHPSTAHWKTFGIDIAVSNQNIMHEYPTIAPDEPVHVEGIAIDDTEYDSALQLFTIRGVGLVREVVQHGKRGVRVFLDRNPAVPHARLKGTSGSIAVVTTKRGERYLAIACGASGEAESHYYEIVCRLNQHLWWERDKLAQR